LSFFFFQAEDGIRDGHVTGVQTCALPISLVFMSRSRIKLLAAFALLLVAVSIFGRAAASREFSSLFGGAAGERSFSGARRAHLSVQTPEEPKPKQRAQFTIYRNGEGEILC